MPPRFARPALAAAALLLPLPLAAQAAHQHGDHDAHESAKPAAGKAAAPMAHHTSGWKELDAFHEYLMATWHPAKAKNDLAPLRAKARDMAAAAAAWGRSTAPAACATPEITAAVKKLGPATKQLAQLVADRRDDATLTAALKAVHDDFEVAEEGCHVGH